MCLHGDNPHCNYVLEGNVLSGDAHVWAMNVISEHVSLVRAPALLSL